MSGLLGFTERFGTEMELSDFVSRVLRDTGRHFGYSQIGIPIMERASSYSEEVVGSSPWPGWKRKGCFFFDIQNYNSSYDEVPTSEHVLLIPEGTLSVTRWLGEQLGRGTISFPIKMLYNLTCYRNELMDTLSQTKHKEFTQFGLEILGSKNPHSDTEILCIAVNCLCNLGIQLSEIRIRLNDITIFNQLIKESHLENRSVEIKELLDTLSEEKAKYGIKSANDTLTALKSIFDQENLSPVLRNKWDSLILQQNYDITDARVQLGESYAPMLDYLQEVRNAFVAYNIPLVIDLCVIRSHEYYTSVSYEIDVQTTTDTYIEIAGGGRYDRLVSSFVPPDCPIQQVSCTGFAFGVERVINILKNEHLIGVNTQITSAFYFNQPLQMVYPKDTSISAYLEAYSSAKDANQPTSVWIG